MCWLSESLPDVKFFQIPITFFFFQIEYLGAIGIGKVVLYQCLSHHNIFFSS